MSKKNTTISNRLIAMFVLTFIGSAFSSCSPILYTSVGQNVPLFHGKGEVTFGGGYADTGDATGVTMQFAVAVDSSLAVSALFHSLSGSYSNEPDFWEGSGTYFEGGVGKFGTMSEGLCAWEVFVGLGYGSIKNTNLNQGVNARYIKPFLQPSISIGTGVVEFAITPRIGVVNYTAHSSTLTDAQNAEVIEAFFDEKSTTLVFEPGVTLRLGYRGVKLQAQYSYSTFSYRAEDWDPVNPEFISIGLQFLITKRFPGN